MVSAQARRSQVDLTVIDEHTRESLAIDVAGSIRSGRLIEVLTKLFGEHGAPKYLRSDNVLSSESIATHGRAHPKPLRAAF
jgi:hypothetical protein